jgi:hypothetical protein
MPDSEFFDRRQLRGSCRKHNLAKGTAEALQRDLAGTPAERPVDLFGRDTPTTVITRSYTRRAR